MVIVFAGSVAVVVYTFAGYPALAWLLSIVRRKPLRLDRSFVPRVSLVVLAYNEEAVIRNKLENTLSLDYPSDRLEIIVVADGSEDGTAERAGTQPDVHVLYEPERRGKLAAMNRAAAVAGGEILVFSDANNHYATDALRELVAPFADRSVGVVTGRKAIDDGTGRALDRAEGLYWRYESKLKEWESAAGSVTAVAGEILAFRREAFTEPPTGTMNEDFVQAMLAALAGWRIVYAPRALSLEAASATIGDEATRRTRLVTGRWQALCALFPRLLVRRPGLAWRVASHKGLRPLIPWALAAAVAGNAALAPGAVWARWFGVAQLSFYAAAGAGWLCERVGRRSRLLYLPYYFCRMNVATLRGFGDFVSRRHEAVWARVERG